MQLFQIQKYDDDNSRISTLYFFFYNEINEINFQLNIKKSSKLSLFLTILIASQEG